jgi:predicted metal-dependent enzyme (double-stranded beta helix superfamily)
MMPADLDRLTIEDLKMLLRIQHEKVAREAEVKRLVKEAVRKAKWLAAEAAAQKAEEEAKEKVLRAIAYNSDLI